MQEARQAHAPGAARSAGKAASGGPSRAGGWLGKVGLLFSSPKQAGKAPPGKDGKDAPDASGTA